MAQWVTACLPDLTTSVPSLADSQKWYCDLHTVPWSMGALTQTYSKSNDRDSFCLIHSNSFKEKRRPERK